MADGKRLLTIGEAANRLGVHQKTLRAWTDKGLVPYVKLPSGYRRFDPEELDQFIHDMRVGGAEDAKKLAA